MSLKISKCNDTAVSAKRYSKEQLRNGNVPAPEGVYKCAGSSNRIIVAGTGLNRVAIYVCAGNTIEGCSNVSVEEWEHCPNSIVCLEIKD